MHGRIAFDKLIWKKDVAYFPAWLCSTAAFLTAFLNVYVTILFSRWMTRDPASATYTFHASSAYVLLTVFVAYLVLSKEN